jgi:hypothetical protein
MHPPTLNPTAYPLANFSYPEAPPISTSKYFEKRAELEQYASSYSLSSIPGLVFIFDYAQRRNILHRHSISRGAHVRPVPM